MARHQEHLPELSQVHQVEAGLSTTCHLSEYILHHQQVVVVVPLWYLCPFQLHLGGSGTLVEH